MSVTKLSVSLPAEIGSAVKQAAQSSGTGVSGWLAEAAAAKLRSEALASFLDEWEAENGPFTPDELRVAEEQLGYGSARPPNK